MRRRRGKVEIRGEAVPDRPLLAHEAAQAVRAMNPKTNAHQTSTPTPCAVCGGACEPASVHWGCWRVHRGCQGLLGDPVGRLRAAGRVLGVDLGRDDAILVLDAGLAGAATYTDVHPEPTWSDEDPMRSRIRWRHVDGDRLRAAAESLPGLRADAGLVETSCVNGVCAWCGTREALGRWADRGHRWGDGTSAPLCASCAVVFDRAGLSESSWWDDQRAAIAEAVAGVPWPMGTTPPTVKAYAEAELNGTGEPWSHLPVKALESFRWSAWALYNGTYAPPQQRAEALRRARAADQAKMVQQAAKAAEQAALNDVYGFGGAA